MKKIIFLLLWCCVFPLHSNAQVQNRNDSIPIVMRPINPIGTGEPIYHAPMHAPAVYLCNHTLYIYAYSEKQVSVYPVDYDDETEPLYSVSVPEYNYSTALPSWLSGTYVIEIVLDGHTFVGEIKL